MVGMSMVEMTGFDGFRLTLVASTPESDKKNKVLVTMRDEHFLFGRDDGIRTHGLCVPNAALYQTEPHLDIKFYNGEKLNVKLCSALLAAYTCGTRNFFAPSVAKLRPLRLFSLALSATGGASRKKLPN